jgi:hypothetical protein
MTSKLREFGTESGPVAVLRIEGMLFLGVGHVLEVVRPRDIRPAVCLGGLVRFDAPSETKKRWDG